MKPRLLDLPQEMLLNILQYLPSSSLMACSLAHPKLKELMLQRHFLDRHFKNTLGLLTSEDVSVSHDIVPKELPHLMHLWFLTHNSACTNDDRKSLLSRESPFYPMESFRHSLLTWVAQAISAKAGIFEVNHNVASIYCHISDYQKLNLFKDVLSLPQFILQPLGKLALVFPDIIWKSILATHCSLHIGKPVNLQNVWYDGFSEEQRILFEHHYCMEILCGQTGHSLAQMSAMMILFRPDKYIVWTGLVACFPGCKFEETWALAVLDTSSSVETTRSGCTTVIESFLSNIVLEQSNNCQWKKQNFYPGLCYQLHQQPRKDLISSLQETVKTLTQSLSELFNPDDHFNMSFSILETKYNLKMLTQRRFTISSDFHSNLNGSVAITSVHIQSSLLQQLDSLFRAEVMDYFGDPEVHEIICPNCCKKWFISLSTFSCCVQQLESSVSLPFDVWPYHCLLAALAKLQDFQNAFFQT
ncbi:hypothetical protein Btru_042777 [Bulinus truncatus]|nr:hypothetical protein Btru_042777 [Bulinus truncatus]